MRDVLRDRGIMKGKIGIAGVGATWGLYNVLVKVLPRSRFISCTEEVDRLRMVKTENELRIMRKAAEIGMAGVEALLETEIRILRAMIEATRPGVSERDVVQAAVTASGGKLSMWYIGHGYGVGVDPPFLTDWSIHKRKEDEVILKTNMVICYEPALLVPGVGTSALEDEIIVTALFASRWV